MAEVEPLKRAVRLEEQELVIYVPEPEVEQLPEYSTWQWWKIVWSNRVPEPVTNMLLTAGVTALILIGSAMVLAAVFNSDAYASEWELAVTVTSLPPLPTRTPVPTATPTKTPWPTLAPQGKGRAMADVFASGYDGFDNRFGTRLMGMEPDFEEYLMCFDGTGIHRHLDGVVDEGTWGSWEGSKSGFCMPGIFYSYTTASDILITSDVVHAIGLSEAKWQQLNVHIYANGAPENYAMFCPAGVVADTSKFCLGD